MNSVISLSGMFAPFPIDPELSGCNIAQDLLLRNMLYHRLLSATNSLQTIKEIYLTSKMFFSFVDLLLSLLKSEY